MALAAQNKHNAAQALTGQKAVAIEIYIFGELSDEI